MSYNDAFIELISIIGEGVSQLFHKFGTSVSGYVKKREALANKYRELPPELLLRKLQTFNMKSGNWDSIFCDAECAAAIIVLNRDYGYTTDDICLELGIPNPAEDD